MDYYIKEIDNCYNRTIERYKTNNKNYTQMKWNGKLVCVI